MSWRHTSTFGSCLNSGTAVNLSSELPCGPGLCIWLFFAPRSSAWQSRLSSLLIQRAVTGSSPGRIAKIGKGSLGFRATHARERVHVHPRAANHVRSSRRVRSRRPGTTWWPTCRSRCRRRSTPARGSRWSRPTWRRSFPEALIRQEMSTERWIEIPGAVRDVYRLWRPTPLKRAPAVREGARHALPDLLQGREHLAGRQPQDQHRAGPGLLQQAGGHRAADHRDRRRAVGHGPQLRVQRLRARVPGLHGQGELQPEAHPPHPDAGSGAPRSSPRPRPRPSRAGGSSQTDPDCPGSLGIAISEAVEEAAADPEANYSLGSVLNHVLLHQTVIGLEAKEQLALAGDRPDYLVGCVGGGSNFGGLVLPFVPDKLQEPGAAASSASSRPPARR